jgi:hypothetical protein
MGWLMRALIASLYSSVVVVVGMVVGGNSVAAGEGHRNFYAIGMSEAAGGEAPRLLYHVAFLIGDLGYDIGYWMASAVGVIAVKIVSYTAVGLMFVMTIGVVAQLVGVNIAKAVP